jgi:hypothetical protein
MAGGSQIIINKDGITIITPAKFESRAGQHLFKSGEKAEVDLPILQLSQLNELCALKSKFGEEQDVKENIEKYKDFLYVD